MQIADAFEGVCRRDTDMTDPAIATQELSWDQRQRFRFLEAHAIWRGQVRVADVRDSFGVSTGRAEKDLAAYVRLAPGNLLRDRRTGEYRPTDAFVPQFLRGTAADTTAAAL